MKLIGIAAVAAMAVLAGTASGEPGPRVGPARYDTAIAQGRSALRSLVRQAPVPAVSIAVAVDGRIVWAEAFGSANLELGIDADASTKFRIASLSKPLTATALMKLAAEGSIDLDAPVASFGEDLAGLPETLTVRQLARHTGGIRHYRQGEISVDEHYPALADAVKIFLGDPLEFSPGTAFRYTTFGYTLLGLAMERATGLRFDELMATVLFEPLAMRDTRVEHWYVLIPGRGAGYEYRQEYGIINATPSDNSCRLPGGGMLSTPSDLVRFGTALLEPGYLPEAALRELFEVTVFEDGSGPGYATGWMVTRDAWGRQVYRHNGNQPGTRSQLALYPEQRVVVAGIANVTRAPLGFDEIQTLVQPFFESEPDAGSTPVDPVGAYDLFADAEDATGPDLELSIWRDFDGPLVASALVSAESRRIHLGSVHVHGPRIRLTGFSAQGVFDGQLVVIEIDTAVGTGSLFTGGRLIPVSVVRK